MLLALRDKICRSSLVLVDKIAFPSSKTKEGVRFLQALQVQDKVLVVLQSASTEVMRTFSNLPGVTVKPVSEITTYLVVNADTVVAEKEAFLSLLGVCGYGR